MTMSILPRHAFVNHAVEFFALFSVGAGDPVICINSSQFPVRMTVYVGRVMLRWGLIAGGLFIAVRGNTAIGRYPEFWLVFAFVSTYMFPLPESR
jgi:hypothetical protein